MLVSPRDALEPAGTTVTVDGEEKDVYLVTIDGQQVEVYDNRSRIGGTYVDPANPSAPPVFAVPADVLAVEQVNFQTGQLLQGPGPQRVLPGADEHRARHDPRGGRAGADQHPRWLRLRPAAVPGREKLFLFYLGSIMIPFVVLIIPLYRLMVEIGWVNDLVSLVIPFVFTAYGTFLMRQFFVTIPKELEEAAILDGASRWTILWKVFVPLSIPAIATLTTFSFLYAWNSFVWPLIVIDSGNQENSVLALTLATLGGRAADNPNLVLAGVMIAMIPPITVFLLAQRYFVENVASSGIKG